MRIAFLSLLAACGGAPAPASQPPAEQTEPAEAEAEADLPAEPVEQEVDAVEPAPPPPWAAEPLAAADVPRVYLKEHRVAENRETCPLLVPVDVEAGAVPRRASFHGGWAVAYDMKGSPGKLSSGEPCATCGRSAFGVAGAGVEKGGSSPAWPRQVAWSDGSRAGYGPEGGDGPTVLAFLELADAGCLYNVWSALGEEHLVVLLGALRRVKASE